MVQAMPITVSGSIKLGNNNLHLMAVIAVYSQVCARVTHAFCNRPTPSSASEHRLQSGRAKAIWRQSEIQANLALFLGKFGHQLKSSNFFSRNMGFRPRDWSHWICLEILCRLVVLMCPKHRFGPGSGKKSIVGHPFQKKVLKYARILLGFSNK